MSQARFEVLEQLDQLEEIVLEGARVPFSGGRLVNEGDAVDVLDAVRQALPSELERAAELLRQREAFLNQARQQAEEIINQAQNAFQILQTEVGQSKMDVQMTQAVLLSQMEKQKIELNILAEKAGAGWEVHRSQIQVLYDETDRAFKTLEEKVKKIESTGGSSS